MCAKKSTISVMCFFSKTESFILEVIKSMVMFLQVSLTTPEFDRDTTKQLNFIIIIILQQSTAECYRSFPLIVPIWRPRRKVLAPTFSQKNLNSFVEVFSRQSCIMIDQLRNVAGRGAFSVWKYLTTYTMDSVCGQYTIMKDQGLNYRHGVVCFFY